MKIIVTDQENGSRVDKVIARSVGSISYVFLQKIFRTKKVKLNGKRAASADVVATGDIIDVFAKLDLPQTPVEKDYSHLLEPLKNMIIYETDDFLAINKPAGLAVQLGSRISICVETYLKAYSQYKCHLVHRLDKETSGVLLIAKNLIAARMLSNLFQENKIKKTYVAIVQGNTPASGKIDNFIDKVTTKVEEKMSVHATGQRAITKYKKTNMFVKDNVEFSFLELYPLTGRKHQLRVHCAQSLNAPIVGDKKYNPNAKNSKFMYLHAWKLEIPDLNIKIIAEAPLEFKEWR